MVWMPSCASDDTSTHKQAKYLALACSRGVKRTATLSNEIHPDHKAPEPAELPIDFYGVAGMFEISANDTKQTPKT
jgi:hypothetical protein